MGKTVLSVLKAFNGDCLLINTFDQTGAKVIILIDGGTAGTFDYTLKKVLKPITQIDLLILTHIDSDHIGGLIKLFKSSLLDDLEIKEFWVNTLDLVPISSGEKISFNQAKTLEHLLAGKISPSKIKTDIIINGKQTKLNSAVTIDVLSPTKQAIEILKAEAPTVLKRPPKTNKVKISGGGITSTYVSLRDLAIYDFQPVKSIRQDFFNNSSIAILISLIDSKILLLGDARSEVIEQSILQLGYSADNPLVVDAVKISHHGSANNTSCRLLDIIVCDHFFISTNGGSSNHKHPDREVIARIIHHPKRNYAKHRRIYFNYPLNYIELRTGKIIYKEDFEDGNWSLIDDSTSFELK